MDRDYCPLLAMFLLGVVLMVTAVVGEVLGWWHDFGNTLGILGVFLTALSTAIALLLGATKKEVKQVGMDVRQVGMDVRQVGTDVRDVGRAVGQVDAGVREGNAKVVALLTEIRDRL